MLSRWIARLRFERSLGPVPNGARIVPGTKHRHLLSLHANTRTRQVYLQQAPQGTRIVGRTTPWDLSLVRSGIRLGKLRGVGRKRSRSTGASVELDHDHYMERAIALGLRKPRAPFGALVVAAVSGEVLAEGVNSVEDSPTRHGEMVAIDAWAAAYESRDDGHLVLYTTAEPCPMCMAAILWARIEVVVFGSSIPHLVREGWDQIEIRAAEIARCTPFATCRLVGGVRKAECDRLFANRPYGDR